MIRRRFVLMSLLSLALGFAPIAGQERATSKRAQLPEFPTTDQGVFFSDVFSRLVGERPSSPTATTNRTVTTGVPSQSEPATAAAAGWSKLVSATTLEDEVKSLKLSVDQGVTTPSDFAGRGHKIVRREFSLLAMLFAIIEEYDGDVRWKSSAAAARQVFARTGANAKAGGNSNVYKESKLRKQDLDDLLRGSSLPAAKPDESDDWSEVSDRAPLMQRLEVASQERLTPDTSNPDAFADNVERIFHEAELTAAIAEVLTREGMEDGEDEDYADLANRMKAAALQVVAAVKTDNQAQARQAAGEVSKSCTDCHDLYR